jgi:hypothetical protein
MLMEENSNVFSDVSGLHRILITESGDFLMVEYPVYYYLMMFRAQFSSRVLATKAFCSCM